MGTVIAIANTKGGVGKTTTAVNLSAALALAGRRVLVCECDTQAQVGPALGIAQGPGLAEVLLGELAYRQAVIPARPGLDVLLGGPRLAAAQTDLARRDFGAELAIREALAGATGYDFVILDTPPGWGPLAIGALFAAGELLVPVPCEPLALRALGDFAARVAAVHRYHTGLVWRYLVPTRLDGRLRQSEEVLAILRAHYGAILCAPIRQNVRLSEAAAHGLTVHEYAPTSRGAADYAALARRVDSAAT